MRITKCLYLLFIFFSAQPAIAQSTYELQPGDAIDIWVAQSTDLTREVTVAPDGWISLPLAGAFDAEGMTLDNLREALTERLQPFFNEALGLNISLLPSDRHEPSFFVAGDVEVPGLYPFRPGMTVLHAVAVAGGLYRPILVTADRDRSLEVQTLLSSSQRRLVELDIMIARLNAQIAGDATFTLPEGAVVGDAAGFLSREQALLSMQSNNISSQRDALNRTVAINQESIAATNEQINSTNRRIELAQERLAATSTLVDRGVVQASQVREIEVNIVDMETSVGQLRSSLATQQAAILTEQSRVDVLVQEYQVDLVTQLGALEQEREAVAADLANYEQTLNLYEPGSDSVNLLTYDIIRPDAGGEMDVDATERTIIMPGDLIRVTRSSASPETPIAAAVQQSPQEASPGASSLTAE